VKFKYLDASVQKMFDFDPKAAAEAIQAEIKQALV